MGLGRTVGEVAAKDVKERTSVELGLALTAKRAVGLQSPSLGFRV